MSKGLVIVESPAKSRTINKILGKKYFVTSSMGHMIDLPKNKMGIDVDNDFKPEYKVIPERRKYLAKLKRETRKAKELYLAPDPDREGEAISWHLKNELGKNKKVYRVVFDEITEKAVKYAFEHPRDIDINLVKAQQARRILDRIVGYSISPILWKKVTRGLSAGRVQSVAVRLVVDREKEIRIFKPKEYWEIEAILKKRIEEAHPPFTAKLEKYENNKIDLSSNKQAQEVLNSLKKADFIVKDIRESKKKRHALPPLTTSTLQQEAFNKLHFPVSRTMRIAQSIYEGLEIGKEGMVGLITYMRTDSVRISADAQKEARDYILNTFGKRYYPEVPNRYKSKKSAQEAHEAIRPTLPLREPESVKSYLKPDQFKLYTLIWNRFISSQMKEALYSQVFVSIMAGKYLFKAVGSNLMFDGFLILYKQEESKGKERKNIIPPLKRQEILQLVKLSPSQHFTKPPAHYSDASLVKALEQKGIGRPSTYAPIIWTIIFRNYVKRISGYLYPTELGEVVNELLVKHFPRILDIKFTAMMEDELDGIEQGKSDWLTVLKGFYSPFMRNVERAKETMKSIKREGIKTDEICPECRRPMIIKWGRRGKFLSCSGFPKCRFAKSITTGIKCPAEGCDGELIERRSKRGPFYGCTRYPKCTYTTRRLPKEAGK
ncbi:MAG: type I DNA topoisomerase [Candidatus Omnitrophica bacterium]|nr:type I DNA topoisomerase [Candidatus Omnitrophota bacterium]